jgi:signal transduction histidine kinase/ActR/RegA family two-component response regulator
MRRGVEIAADQLPIAVAARTGQEVRDAELDLVFGNGRIVHLLVNAAPLFDADGERRGAIGVHVDITALKHVQNELERVSRQKDVFLATLAHELRNPLAPVRYATALLKPGAAPASIEEARRVIERQARQMSQLLDELLDMSRVTRDAIELKREPVDMARVVRQELDALRPYLTDLGHEVTLDTTQYSWVIGDSTRLHQIVSNLLSNAAKYTHMGGRIVVNVATEADTVVVRVRDSGIGIAREDLDRVFDLFSQVRRQGNVPAGGLGIGLAVVRRLVELHGGRIRASSDGAGHGAEFTVSLPRAEAPARSERRTPAEPSSRPQGVLRVLVVDDNVDAADTLAALMRMNDLDVRVAYDGVAAKEEADEFRPEVLLLDLGMPGLTGEQVARWVREQDWGDEAMLVAVTGWGQPQDRARTAAAGFDHHYVKPVEPERLLDLVNQRRARRRERAAVS